MREDRSARGLRWFAFAAVLAGAFLALFGVGSGLWWTSVLGVALVVGAAGLSFTAYAADRDRTVAFGRAYVMETTLPPADGFYGRCEMLLAIEAPGLQPLSILVRDPRVPVAVWPSVGVVLPIRVSPRNPKRLHVLWDHVSANRAASSPR